MSDAQYYGITKGRHYFGGPVYGRFFSAGTLVVWTGASLRHDSVVRAATASEFFLVVSPSNLSLYIRRVTPLEALALTSK